MTQFSGKELEVKIPLYALPKNTDLQTFAPIVRELAASLEVMGVFGQREFEPAHVFDLAKGTDS